MKQKDRVQLYLAEPPDFYDVIEQELPRFRERFASLKEAIQSSNQKYATWQRTSLEEGD